MYLDALGKEIIPIYKNKYNFHKQFLKYYKLMQKNSNIK